MSPNPCPVSLASACSSSDFLQRFARVAEGEDSTRLEPAEDLEDARAAQAAALGREHMDRLERLKAQAATRERLQRELAERTAHRTSVNQTKVQVSRAGRAMLGMGWMGT